MKMTGRRQNIIQESRLTPSHVRHFLALVQFTEIPVGYARIFNSHQKKNIINSFSCILFLQQLQTSNISYFVNFMLLKYLFFFCQEMFCSAPTYDIDVETSGGK